MKQIELRKFSEIYNVRKLDVNNVEMIYNFCKKNTQYYECCGKEISVEFSSRKTIMIYAKTNNKIQILGKNSR